MVNYMQTYFGEVNLLFQKFFFQMYMSLEQLMLCEEVDSWYQNSENTELYLLLYSLVELAC